MQPIPTTLTPNTQAYQWHTNGAGPHKAAPIDGQTLPLVQRLCTALAGEAIRYCHWKSNAAIDRTASGDNDLDLLIDRKDRERFTAIVSALGFKAAGHEGEAHLPGVVSYYGYEESYGKLIHVHAHYQLVLGHDRTKNYRLPLEDAYLASATQQGLFYIPTPEFEFVVFVLRMILKYATWDAVLGRQAKLPASAQRELTYLLERVQWPEVNRILAQHLPVISPDLFSFCVQTIQGRCSLRQQVKAGRLVQRVLQAYTRRAPGQDLFLKGWRRVENGVRRRLGRGVAKARMSGGGAMIAIVGGDGAGKSTAIAGLSKWIGKEFAVKRLHLGKPRRSLLTKVVRSLVGLLRLPAKLLRRGQPVPASATVEQSDAFPGYLALLLLLCVARDRYHTYVAGRRFVNDGGIVICDRFPLRQVKRMDGPQIEQLAGPRAQQWLLQQWIKREERYYAPMVEPEALAILRLDPEVAVQRKPEEPAHFVRLRSAEIWTADWQQSSAQIIDAARPKEEVLTELKSLLWSKL